MSNTESRLQCELCTSSDDDAAACFADCDECPTLAGDVFSGGSRKRGAGTMWEISSFLFNDAANLELF